MSKLTGSIVDGVVAVLMLASSYKLAIVDRELLGAAMFGFMALVFAFGCGMRATLYSRGE